MGRDSWCRFPASVPFKDDRHWQRVTGWLFANIAVKNHSVDGPDPANPNNRIVWFGREAEAKMFKQRWS